MSLTDEPSKDVPAPIRDNIHAIEEYYRRQGERASYAQRALERFSSGIGRPWFLGCIMLFVALWITFNLLASRHGTAAFDPAPFPILHGLIGLAALLTTIIVLIGQNRLSRLEHRREQLELQVNLLTEQKTTKLVRLVEELRRDLPMVRDRHDPDAKALEEPADAAEILKALEESQKDQTKT